MPRHLFFIVLMALSFYGIANTVRGMNARAAAISKESQSSLPNLNIEAGCQDLAKNDLNKTTNYPGCISEERQAAEPIAKGVGIIPSRHAYPMHASCDASRASELCVLAAMP